MPSGAHTHKRLTCPRCGKVGPVGGMKSFHIPNCGREEEIFWAKIDKAAGPAACWPFKGFLNHDGYGRTGNSRLYPNGARAHRVAWELANQDKVPPGEQVLHRCDNRACCNPAHLFIGDHDDNMLDMNRKGRRQSRLTNDQVREIRAATGDRSEIAARYGVDYNAVWAIQTGRKWRFVQ